VTPPFSTDELSLYCITAVSSPVPLFSSERAKLCFVDR
jgi:hypothetical protein